MNDPETTPLDSAAPENTPRDLRGDLGGLVLFALAIFLGVSVVMAASRPEPEVGGTTGLVTWIVGLMGVWPLLLLAACLGFLGARVWIAALSDGLVRNAVWSLFLALALALTLGAASAGAGGAFGDITGGAIERLASIFVAVPLGLASVAAVVWFGWLRPPDWNPVLSPDEPAPSVYTATDSEGLTADEAEALLPSELPEEVAKGELTGRSIAVAPDLPPLYPPDVRREGRIPDGARALESRDEPAPRTAAPAPERSELEEPAAGVAGEPVAEPARGEAHQAADGAVQPAAQPLAQAAAGSVVDDLAPALPHWERPRDLGRTPLDEEPAAAPKGATLHISAPPVRSAWESEEEEVVEEEVLTADVEDEVEDDEVYAEDEEAELDESEADDSEESEEEEYEDSEEEDDEVYAEDDSEDVEEEDEDSGEAEEVEAELDDDAYEEDEEEEVEETEAELDEDEEAELDEDEEAELDEDEAAELDEEEYEEDEDDEAAELVDEPPLAEDPEVVADVAAAAAEAESEPAAPPAGRAAWEQGGLFDDEPVDAYGTPVTLVAALREANQETAERLAAPESEPEVELQPQPRAEPKPKAPAAKAKAEPAASAADLDPEDDLVFRAGMLFVERGRVAVSMLQRSFELDFKAATALLDQLQEAGLIGPYLGGQKRDILLSAEEWRERRVAAR